MHLVSVPAVHKEELRRTVLGVLRVLLLTDFTQIPHVKSSVSSARCHHGLAEWRPGDAEYLIDVSFEGVEFELGISEVPKSNRVVSRPGQQQEFAEGVERQTVHLHTHTKKRIR